MARPMLTINSCDPLRHGSVISGAVSVVDAAGPIFVVFAILYVS